MNHAKCKEQTAFAARLGYSGGFIHDILHGRKEISKKLADKLCSEFGVTLAWALYGRGQPWPTQTKAAENAGSYAALPDGMLIETLRERLQERQSRASPIILTPEADNLEELEGRDVFRAIPYASLPAAAGQGRVMDDAIAGYVVIHERVAGNVDNLVAVRVDGDSMMPVLSDGSIVAIDVSRRDPRELEGKIVASHTDIPDEIVIKRAHLGGHYLFLVSDNPSEDYKPIEINLRQVENPIIGQVVWAWQDLR